MNSSSVNHEAADQLICVWIGRKDIGGEQQNSGDKCSDQLGIYLFIQLQPSLRFTANGPQRAAVQWVADVQCGGKRKQKIEALWTDLGNHDVAI